MGIAKYNDECRAIVQRYSKEWEAVVQRMGRWIDFENDYKTMEPWWVTWRGEMNLSENIPEYSRILMSLGSF